jgi:hypothetical protein
MTEPPSVIIQEFKSTLTPFTFPIFPAIFPEVVFELSSIWFPLHRLRYIGNMLLHNYEEEPMADHPPLSQELPDFIEVPAFNDADRVLN